MMQAEHLSLTGSELNRDEVIYSALPILPSPPHQRTFCFYPFLEFYPFSFPKDKLLSRCLNALWLFSKPHYETSFLFSFLYGHAFIIPRILLYLPFSFFLCTYGILMCFQTFRTLSISNIVLFSMSNFYTLDNALDFLFFESSDTYILYS